MKMFRLIAFVAIIFSATLKAGDGSGAHGADIDSDSENVWFLGSKPVDYCVIAPMGAPYSRLQYSEIVRQSLDSWIEFLKKYGLDSVRFGSGRMRFPDLVEREISTNFVEVETCEHPESQIRFQISMELNSTANREFIADSEHSLGAAVRGKYNHNTYRTGGTVWLSEKVDSLRSVKHILLHEIGHVLGMQHDSVWVMYEKAAQQAMFEGRWDTDALGEIESSSWKYKFLVGDSLRLRLSADSSDENAGRKQPQLPKSWTRQLDKEAQAENPLFFSMLKFERIENQNKFFIIEIHDSSQHSVEIPGRFDQMDHSPSRIGPSIFTNWRIRNSNGFSRGTTKDLSYLESTLPLGIAGNFALPAHGTFQYEGVTYPSIIQQRIGAVVKIFNPESAVWMILFDFPLRRELNVLDL